MKLRFVVLLIQTPHGVLVVVWIKRGPLPKGGGPNSSKRMNGRKILWQ